MSLPQGMSLATLAPGVDQILLAGDRFSARIALLGGQLIDYRRDGEPPLLYLSPQTACQPGKAIRGGVPVCWPWFGPHPSDAGLPAHGVARQQVWRLSDAGRDGKVFHVKLDGPRHGGLAAELDFRISPDGAEIALTTANLGDAAQTVGAALHSYFAVSGIDKVDLLGLEGAPAHDKVAGLRVNLPALPLRFDGETDLIAYRGGLVTLRDAGWRRDIRIESAGSHSAVVWNPAQDKAQRLADLPDEAWRRFVCVETANAGDDARALAPGERHRLACRLHFSCHD
ncbi:D-hexose-6-phosphate mutarotase [Chromobacterium violaceum]|uniref:D-hexose-6-phosphate mutarotase n=1 Tax=Chromobacterium violaceum TaxID=536 RepID=UPI0009BC2B0C|nr:D-hexose-6-phosphate mutarotase [Chromobacterium violaceum]